MNKQGSRFSSNVGLRRLYLRNSLFNKYQWQYRGVRKRRETTQRTLGKRRFLCCPFRFLEVEHINHILFIYNIVFCLCSFSLQFYGINFLCPASSSFLYLVSKRSSSGCTRNDNSVSFHHAIYAHQCQNSQRIGITNSLK